MIECGLSRNELAIIAAVLRPYAGKISGVGIFGSRATGGYKAHSDIDLVLYGNADARLPDRLFTLFDESALALKVDVKSYNHIEHAPLKRHIDAAARPLFSARELRAAD